MLKYNIEYMHMLKVINLWTNNIYSIHTSLKVIFPSYFYCIVESAYLELLFPTFCYFLFLSSNYTPKHPVLRQPTIYYNTKYLAYLSLHLYTTGHGCCPHMKQILPLTSNFQIPLVFFFFIRPGSARQGQHRHYMDRDESSTQQSVWTTHMFSLCIALYFTLADYFCYYCTFIFKYLIF
jgi:hypothetical protein